MFCERQRHWHPSNALCDFSSREVNQKLRTDTCYLPAVPKTVQQLSSLMPCPSIVWAKRLIPSGPTILLQVPTFAGGAVAFFDRSCLCLLNVDLFWEWSQVEGRDTHSSPLRLLGSECAMCFQAVSVRFTHSLLGMAVHFLGDSLPFCVERLVLYLEAGAS